MEYMVYPNTHITIKRYIIYTYQEDIAISTKIYLEKSEMPKKDYRKFKLQESRVFYKTKSFSKQSKK